MAPETGEYLGLHPAVSVSADTGNLLLNLGHGWDTWYGHKASQQRFGKAEVLVPGPAVVLCCGSSKLDHHPMVSAFPPLLCPVVSFLGVSTPGHGK